MMMNQGGGGNQQKKICKFYPNCNKGQNCPFLHVDKGDQGGSGQGGQGGYKGGFKQGGYGQGGNNQGGQGGFNQGGYNQGGYNQGGGNQGNYGQGQGNQGGHGGPYRKQGKQFNDGMGNFQKKSVCQFFQKNNSCDKGQNCKYLHIYTNKDDLNFKVMNCINEINQQNKIVKMMYSNQNNRNLILIGMYDQIKIYCQEDNNFIDKIQPGPIQTGQFSITTFDFINGSLYLGVLDQNTKQGSILLFPDNIGASPAHESEIVSIFQFQQFIVSASKDRTIKFWQKTQQNLQFVYKEQQMADITVAKSFDFNGKQIIAVGNNLGILTLFMINDQTQKLESQYSQQLHQGPITDICLYCSMIISTSCNSQYNPQGINGLLHLLNLTDQSLKSYEFRQGITALSFVLDKTNKEVMILGFKNGSVKLYDNLATAVEYGDLKCHTMNQPRAEITSFATCSSEMNGIKDIFLFIGDSNCYLSIWGFQQSNQVDEQLSISLQQQYEQYKNNPQKNFNNKKNFNQNRFNNFQQ